MRVAASHFLALALAVAAFTTPVAAADLSTRAPSAPPIMAAPMMAVPPQPLSLWELRLGGSMQDPSGPESGSFNVTGEVLTPRLGTTANPVVNYFIPRAHVGGSANTRGDTSFAYAGFTWTFDITQQLFVEGTLGGAIHNGNTERVVTMPDESALGCSPLFRESASLGYRLTQNWSVMGTVEHLSNAGLCSQNRGLTNVGLRVGYSF
jgi:lipid A 3-O-deacylase